MNIPPVLERLAYRYPSVLVDAIHEHEPGRRMVAIKNVTVNEEFFQGHFPGHPVLPGVLQLESMAQVAGMLMVKRADKMHQIAYFIAADRVKWRKPVFPGEVLVIEVELTKSRGKIGKASGVCKVGGEIVSEAEVTFMLMDG